MKRSTLALVDSEEHARATVERLTSAGFSQDDISVLFADRSNTREFAHEKETKLPEGATIGAGIGGIAGALIGLGVPEDEARRYQGAVKGGLRLRLGPERIQTNGRDSASVPAAFMV